jgi:hypothetical protein
MDDDSILGLGLTAFFCGFMVFLGLWLLVNLGVLWEDFVAPQIRSWRYERRMEKEREKFLLKILATSRSRGGGGNKKIMKQ